MEIPEPLQGDHIRTIVRDQTRYVLIGTAHVSKKSVAEVGDIIRELKPDAVCVELCQNRYSSLVDENRWRHLNIFQIIKEGKTMLLLANLALSSFQRKIGEQFGVQPGAELKAAIEATRDVDAQLVLADRDVQITLKRTWANIPWWKKFAVLGGVIESLWAKVELSEEDLEGMKEKDQLSHLMEEFAKELPEVKTPLIDERDQYLASKIQETQGEIVVAVVGAGHLDGIARHFDTPVDRRALDELPPKTILPKILKWVIPAIILAAFSVGFLQHRGETFREMLFAWILPNSIMAAILSIVAGAKLISILVALVASPITSLNPALGAGMVVGLVEAWLRKPTVADLEHLQEDVKSLRGFYRNPFTRVLLVAVLSTLGSALGAFIGMSWVLAVWAS